MFYQMYVAALTAQPYTSGAIRIAEHSLGNQMAVRLAQLGNEGIAAGSLPGHLRPMRVALLDPYWSPELCSYLGNRTTGGVARQAVAELTAYGTLLERYRSSAWITPPQDHSRLTCDDHLAKTL